MRVCLLTWWGDSLTYTVARALTANGHTVDILVTDRERHLGNRWGNSARIREIPGVRFLLERSELSHPRYDLLIIQSYPKISSHGSLVADLGRRSSRVTLISFGDLVRGWRSALGLQVRELRAVLPLIGRIGTIAYKDGFHRFDLFGTLARRTNVGFDVHSRFLHTESLFHQIHARNWRVNATRPTCINFVGSRDPARRGDAVDQIERFLKASGEGTRNAGRIRWRVYSDAEPAALPETEFVDILSNSDFTLAPPGHSLITHRPIESMLRGSVPILNETEAPIYEIGLCDGENCLLVREGNWSAAVSRALSTSQDEVARMRANLWQMNESQLQYASLSKGICSRLGVQP